MNRPHLKPVFPYHFVWVSILWVPLIFFPGVGSTHPHVFMETSLCVVFDEEGMVGIEMTWVYDDYFAGMMLEGRDSNRDGIYDASEIEKIEADEIQILSDYSYYTFIEVDGISTPVEAIKDFSIKLLEDRKLVYEFFVPCRVLSATGEREVRISQYDPDYYVHVDFDSDNPVVFKESENYETEVEIGQDKNTRIYFNTVSPQSAVLRFKPKAAAVQSATSIVQSVSHPEQVESVTFLLPASPVTTASGHMQVASSELLVQKVVEEPPQGSFLLLNLIAQWQKDLRTMMAESTRQIQQTGKIGGILWILILAFLYGVIHAVGPGHGKAVTMSCLVAHNWKYLSAIFLGLLIALFHALSGILLVLALRLILNHSLHSEMGSVNYWTQSISYSLIAIFGLVLFYHALSKRRERSLDESSAVENRGNSARHPIYLALAVGLVPCPGVVLVLLFCLSMNAFGLGILLAGAQALGMAFTLSCLGILTLFMRKQTVDRVGRNTRWLAQIERGLEVGGAVLLVVLGSSFLISTVLR